ncbi:unnamed protein product [Gongylonema pulchrum]|uniref:MFS domain-containing protein n=1 Tax=Gongylonema pulchrum TaxID=637853 RepID=A0A183DXG5_9BILA|nr:unnamed protein product [Gongylonema pulchrum]
MRIHPKAGTSPASSSSASLGSSVFYISRECHYPPAVVVSVPRTDTVHPENKTNVCVLQSTTLPALGNDSNGTVPLISISDADNNHSRLAATSAEKQPPVEVGTAKKSEAKCGLYGSTRYVILLVAVLTMTAARANEMTFNLTVICMTSNSTIDGVEPVEMTPGEISTIFAGGGIGAIAFVLPIAYALHRLGARSVFGMLLLLSAVGTALMPYAARLALLWMVSIRIVQGITLAAVMPMMGCVSASWAPIAEIGNFVTMLSSCGQLSQIFTMPLAAHLCVTSGWPSAFYTHALISATLALAFLGFYRNSPSKHPCISSSELLLITEGATIFCSKTEASQGDFGAILVDRKQSFGVGCLDRVSWQCIRFMPTYLNKALNVPIERTGLSAIVPPTVQLLVKMIAGVASDKMTISEKRKLQFFNTLAMVGCAVFLLPLGFLSSEHAGMALVCFTGGISCVGLVTCGSLKSAALIARTFTEFVMAIIQVLLVFMRFLQLCNAKTHIDEG